MLLLANACFCCFAPAKKGIFGGAGLLCCCCCCCSLCRFSLGLLLVMFLIMSTNGNADADDETSIASYVASKLSAYTQIYARYQKVPFAFNKYM